MSEITLSHADHVAIGSEVANFLMFREWNTPHADIPRLKIVVLSEESIQAIADEISCRLV